MGMYQGKLLIAVPDLQDTNFLRTVVLILHHDQFGASGLILNRPTDTRVSDLVSQLDLSSDPVATLNHPIHVGGPVEGPLIVLHTDQDLAEESVTSGVFVSTRKDLVERLLLSEHPELRLFSGYSGWSPEQLDSEIECGGWLLMDAQHDHVFGSSEELWKQVCEEFGSDVCQLPRPFGDDEQSFDPGLN